MEIRPTKTPRKPAKKIELLGWAARTKPELIGEAEWDTLLRLLTPVSEGYLRRLLRDFSRESGVPLAPLVEGVRQESLDALESSLLKLLAEYERGSAAVRSRVRKAVIEAKEHARLASRKPELREAKAEMILWMLTWLENPPVFPAWASLRRGRIREN